MYELRLHDRITAIPQADWDALAAADPSPFVEWTWLDCMEQAGCVGGDSGWHPCHFGLYRTGSDDGARPTLCAAVPAYLKTNSEGEFVFDWSWADLAGRIGVPYYPKLVCAVPFTPAGGARVLVHPDLAPAERDDVVRSIAAHLRKLAPELGVHGVHALFPGEAETERWSEAGYLVRHGIQYHFHNRGYRTFEDFLTDLPSKRRTQLRREMRQPAADGITIATLPPDGYTPPVVAAMYEIYLSTVDKFAWGRRYITRRFFDLVAERFRDRLAWVVARREGPNGPIIAGAFNVRKGRRLYGRYWGALVEVPFLHFNVCYYHGIAECIREGIDVFEPGAGGEHKRPRGFRPTRTFSAHHLEDRRLRQILGDHLRRERLAVQRELDGEEDG